MEAWTYSLTFVVIYFNQQAGGVSGITMRGCKEGWIDVTEENNTVITCYSESPTQPMAWTVENDVRNQIIFEGSCDSRLPVRCNPSANSEMSLQVHDSSQTLLINKNHRLYDGFAVTCSQDSSHVTCRMKVIYGPQSVRISPSVSRPFVTNGTARITLTCKADDAYPAVTYSWSGVTCVNKNHSDGTCMFTPRVPEDEGHEVWCTARNTVSGIQKKENYLIQLNYPPTSPPEITRHSVLTEGENVTLTCTVKGGKPKVTSVTFFCGDEADRPDVVDGVSVSSSIIIRVQPKHNKTVCQCSATWDRQPDLYPYKTFTSLYVQGHSSSQEQQSVHGIVAGVTVTIVVIIILTISLAIVIKRRRNRSRALSQNSDEKNKERNEFEEQVNMIYDSADMNSNQPTLCDSPHLPHSTNPYFPFEELTQSKASNSIDSSTAQTTTQASFKDTKGESEEVNTEHDYSVVNDGFFGK